MDVGQIEYQLSEIQEVINNIADSDGLRPEYRSGLLKKEVFKIGCVRLKLDHLKKWVAKLSTSDNTIKSKIAETIKRHRAEWGGIKAGHDEKLFNELQQLSDID